MPLMGLFSEVCVFFSTLYPTTFVKYCQCMKNVVLCRQQKTALRRFFACIISYVVPSTLQARICCARICHSSLMAEGSYFRLENHHLPRRTTTVQFFPKEKNVQFEILHEQLPLPVPCYYLPLVIELTVGRDKRRLRVFPTPLG